MMTAAGHASSASIGVTASDADRGIVTGAVALLALLLHPVLGLGYLLWWVFLIAWLLAIAWALTRLGMRPASARRRSTEPAAHPAR